MEQMNFLFDQRWAERREVLRFRGDRINPGEYGVEVIGDAVAKAFVTAQHYSGSYPAAHCAVGLFRRVGVAPARLVGVAVFSEGVQSTLAMPKYTGFDRSEGTELGRLVLLPEVPFNGESWFIRRAFDALRAAKPRLRVVLSYADPVERTTAAGQVVKPGHFGTIYQASNALYLGRATPRTLRLAPDGTVLHPYLFNKVARERRGAAYAERALLAAGAAARLPGEAPAAWAARVASEMRTIRHPGNLTYAFGLDGEAWARIRALHPARPPYPKKRETSLAA